MTEQNKSDNRAGQSERARGGSGPKYGLSEAAHQGWMALLLGHAQATARVSGRVESEGGLPLDWYDVLLALENAPAGRLRMGELGEHVVLSRSGLTRLVDRIEAAGLVERHLCSSDRRSFEAQLTAKGRKAREENWPSYARAIAQEFGNRYNEEEIEVLAELLNRQLGEPNEGEPSQRK